MKTTYEPCPECGNEHECRLDGTTICPDCKTILLPCTACELACTNECNWDKYKGCAPFPNVCSYNENSRLIPTTEPRPPAETVVDYCHGCGANVLVIIEWWRCTDDCCKGRWWSKGAMQRDVKCDKCLEKQLEAERITREYLSDIPPAWFDELDAGERWNDDY